MLLEPDSPLLADITGLGLEKPLMGWTPVKAFVVVCPAWERRVTDPAGWECARASAGEVDFASGVRRDATGLEMALRRLAWGKSIGWLC